MTELAGVLGISDGAAKHALFRARASLASALGAVETDAEVSRD